MPIRLPVQTAILTSDFRDKTYCFAVESVIMPQERGGLLTISTSTGYLLATSLDKELKRQQAFKHILQTDGSWFASGTVTVILTGDSATDGVITIRNSVGETRTLTIDATSTSLVQSPKPGLTVSHPTLIFPQTSPGKPSFMVLTIAQQPGNAPVTLTTDAPDYFLLASDNRPAFSPTLSFTPSVAGAYVHVRYSASKNGRHFGTLTIQNQNDKRTVTLEGRSSGFLPAFRQDIQHHPNQPAIAKRWMKLLSLVVIGGLAYAGYTNRCQLVPALCQEPEISQFSGQTNELLPASSPIKASSEKVAINSVITKRASSKEKPTSLSERSNQNRVPLFEPAAKQTTSDKPEQEPAPAAETLQPVAQKKSINQESHNQQNHQRTAPTTPTDESELERILNQKP